MSQIRLYVDEDAEETAIVDALRSRGVDLLTTLDAGMTRATDEEQLAFATSEGRAIYSLNVGHFCQLHAEFLAHGRDHSGILIIPRQRYSVGEKVRRLMELIDSTSSQEMRNRPIPVSDFGNRRPCS
jgi:hypothetical protein